MALLKLIPYEPLWNYDGPSPLEETIRGKINYVTNPLANIHQIYGGYNFLSTTPDDIITQFIAVHRYYGKPNFVPVQHIVLSLNPYSFIEERVSPYQLALIADRFCSYVFADNFQVLYGIHEDTKELHAHIIVNTVNFRTRQLLAWNYELSRKIYYEMEMILKLNSYWKGKYPINNLIQCYS